MSNTSPPTPNNRGTGEISTAFFPAPPVLGAGRASGEETPRTVDWRDGQVIMIDQTRLPREYVTVAYSTPEEVADAIRTMVVRGAPAIGAAAALGLALGAQQIKTDDDTKFHAQFDALCTLFSKTRPTAVNLFWAIERMRKKARARPLADVRETLLAEALAVLDEDVAANRALGAHGAALLAEDATVLTHCNAGALATVGYGTALGVIRAAVAGGKRIRVLADETRPRLQGMKLTAWELARDGIDVTILCDSAAGALMQKGEIDAVIVGADRIAANGDTANKIGTYTAAVLAYAHGIPFYVAAPLSTVDFELADGSQIPIEQRGREEVSEVGSETIAPVGVPVLNYAFDVTPAKLITTIITERGVAYPPFERALAELR